MNRSNKNLNFRFTHSVGIHGIIPMLAGGLLIILFLIDVAFAQNSQNVTRNIKGFVRDMDTGEALPFANVILKGTKFGAATNTDGYFIIINAPAGICTLQVSYIGYTVQEIIVNNAEGLDDIFTIEMSESPLQAGEVVVRANEQMVEVSNNVSQITLSPRDLFSLPSIGEVDVFRTLQLLPGISAANDGSSGLYVRGGTPDQNLILFDGMTIYHVDHFYGFFSAFNADAIKDIQVYKGGFPAEYGGRISSVVNLTGKTGDQNKFRFGLGANLLSGHAVVEVPLFNKGAWLLSARRSYTDYVQSSLYDKIYGFLTGGQESGRTGRNVQMRQGRFGRNQNVASSSVRPNFYFYDVNSKLTLTPTQKDILSLSIYNGEDNLDKSQDTGSAFFRFRDSPNAGAGSLITNDVTEWGNSGISGKWSRLWHDRFYTHLSAAYSSYFSMYDRNSGFETEFSQNDSLNIARGRAMASEEDNKVKDFTVRFDNELHVTKSHQLKFGTWLSKFNSSYQSTLNDTTRLLSRNTEALQSSFYLQDKWKPWYTLAITFGVRGTSYDQTSKNFYEPRASFNYSLTDKFSLKGAWGHYHQFINRIANENILEGSRDFWLLAGDEFEPSFAEHQIIGASYENEDYLFDVEAYRKNLENLIEYSRRYNARADYNNRFFFGTGVAEGIDFLVQKKRGMLTGWIGYTLGMVEYNFPLLNNGQPFPADHDRKHELKMVGRLSKGKWDFAATWVYATGRAYTSPESQYYLKLLDNSAWSYIHVSGKNANRLPAYHRLDLSISRRFEINSAKLDVGASVFNAYNRSNIWYKEYNLDVSPMVITDIVMLGFTPTVYFQFNFR